MREDEGKRKGREKDEDETVVKRRCVNPVSVDVLDILSQGEISECGSECGSVDESGKWSIALVSNDIYVLPSFAVEVVGVGEMSDSGWKFGSECGLLMFWVSVVTVMCGGVPSDSEWDFFGTAVFFFLSLSKKSKFACVEEQEDMNHEGTMVKAG